MSSIYPDGVVSWVPRINNVDIIWANDPNSLADELIAIESIVGVNPQIETGVSSGSPITYATVSDRIAALARGVNLPYVTLENVTRTPIRHGDRYFHTYGPASYNADPFNMYNGADITVPADGIWVMFSKTHWDSEGRDIDGFCQHHMYLNDEWIDFDTWRWDFPNSYYWPRDIIGNLGINKLTYLGPLHKGDRFQLMSINGCSFSPLSVAYSTLRAQMIREMPS